MHAHIMHMHTTHACTYTYTQFTRTCTRRTRTNTHTHTHARTHTYMCLIVPYTRTFSHTHQPTPITFQHSTQHDTPSDVTHCAASFSTIQVCDLDFRTSTIAAQLRVSHCAGGLMCIYSYEKNESNHLLAAAEQWPGQLARLIAMDVIPSHRLIAS